MAKRKNANVARKQAAQVAAQARRRQKRQDTIRKTAMYGVAVAAAGGIVAAAVLAGGKGTSTQSLKVRPVNHKVDLRSTPPPWDVPSNEAAYIKDAGLPSSYGMSETFHIHAHLDILNQGKAVTIPANLGIDAANQTLSPLHTHDATGILHVEFPKKIVPNLDRLFTEWNVRLDQTCMGSLCTDGTNELRAYVNGKRYSGDPRQIQITNHQEIVLWYGPKSEASPKVPATFDFKGL